MVTTEQGLLLAERVAEVVRGVAGREDGLHGPALTRHHVALAQGHVGREGGVDGLLRHDFVARVDLPVGPACEARRAGLGVQPRRQGRVVGMAVRDEDVRDLVVDERGREGVAVRREIGPGIDHRHPTVPDDVVPVPR